MLAHFDQAESWSAAGRFGRAVFSGQLRREEFQSVERPWGARMDELWQGRLLRHQLQRTAQAGEASTDRLDEQLAVSGKDTHLSLAWADEPSVAPFAFKGSSGSGVRTGAGDCAPARCRQAHCYDSWNGPQGQLIATEGVPFELDLQFGAASEPFFGVRLYSDDQHWTDIGFNRENHQFYMDRTKSSEAIGPGFLTRTTAPLVDGRPYDLKLVVDRSSVEAYAQSGTIALTDLISQTRMAAGRSVFRKRQIAEIHRRNLEASVGMKSGAMKKATFEGRHAVRDSGTATTSIAVAFARCGGNPTRVARRFLEQAPCLTTTVRYTAVIRDAVCNGRRGQFRDSEDVENYKSGTHHTSSQRRVI